MEAPELNDEFLDVMIDVLPNNLPIISMLLTSGSISYSNQVNTASIAFTDKIHIRINKEFVESKCDNIYHLASILLHEFLHKHLGHFVRDIENELDFIPKITDWHKNFIFDLHVNAMLYLITNKSRAFCSFLEKYYGKNEDPRMRMLSPYGQFEEFMHTYIHKKIYTVVGVSYLTIAEQLFPELFMEDEDEQNQQPQPMGGGSGNSSGDCDLPGGGDSDNDSDDDRSDSDKPDFIGDHGSQGTDYNTDYIAASEEIQNELEKQAEKERQEQMDDVAEKQASGVFSEEEARKINEHNEKEIKASMGKNAGNLKTRTENTIEDAKRKYAETEKLRKKIAKFSEKSTLSKLKSSLVSMVMTKMKITRKLNFKNRKTLSYFVNGSIPPYDISRDKPETSVKICIYVDVSGSQEWVIPFVRMLLKDMKKYIQKDLFLFDTEVVKIPLSKYAGSSQVKVDCLGGTRFDSVIEHAAENKNHNLLIITDGYSSVSDENQSLISSKKINILTAYTDPPGRNGEGLFGIEKESFLLEEVCRL